MQSTAISIKNLFKTYANGLAALKGISLEIAQGDFFALLGPNGAGKSTTIGVLSTLVTKSSGEVEIMGHNMDTNAGAAKLSLGVVPQEFNFNQFEKVQDIILNQAGFYGVPYRHAKPCVDEYLKKLDLWDKRNEVSRNLSGGMKRRLMIARALVHSPKILILDEPTAGVDVELRRTMWDFLRYINEEKKVTIILTTHYLEEAENLCRGIAIIDKGEIIENTTVRELLSRVNKNVLQLELSESIDKAPELSGCEVSLIDAKTIEVQTKPGLAINDIFNNLSKQNINVSGLRNTQSRLETLFVDITKNNKVDSA
ncbi:MAG: ABC transporter ATP-binding protein [Francisellaceae bacterium]|mgnify:CR=1 FL=1|jgi:ABC-2 type transport system ATP-binding protein|nr:ABC transporter ATP-binding protein [Francisellaceae bacterium]MBT6206413.1 ABC transporter ATP-binding protein [Francisellaceae bacterium]MBT6539321.1 ABC transporter ATP-binding protein [Francisellaceae bacterium]